MAGFEPESEDQYDQGEGENSGRVFTKMALGEDERVYLVTGKSESSERKEMVCLRPQGNDAYDCPFRLENVRGVPPGVEIVSCSHKSVVVGLEQDKEGRRRKKKVFGWGDNYEWTIGQPVPIVYKEPCPITHPENEQ